VAGQCRFAFFVHFPTLSLPSSCFCIFCGLSLSLSRYFLQVGTIVCQLLSCGFFCLAKQARAKAAPYPRQTAASTQLGRAIARRDFTLQHVNGFSKPLKLRLTASFAASAEAVFTSFISAMRWLRRRRRHHRLLQPLPRKVVPTRSGMDRGSMPSIFGKRPL
jgi:hypothetical protein